MKFKKANRTARSLSEEFRVLVALFSNPDATIEQLVSEVGERGHALLVLVLAFPFCLPLPLPGLSIPFGVLIFIAGIRYAMGKGPWVPRRWRAIKLHGQLLPKIFRKGALFAKRMEKIIRPRGKWLVVFPGVRVLNGCLLALSGFVLALPLPPGTNSPPAIPLALLAVGLIEEDGLLVGIAYGAYLLLALLLISVANFGFSSLFALFS